MIIARLIGGLGNQMFQYAVGRRLSHVLCAELKLDISEFNNCTFRRYTLGAFNILENFAEQREVDRIRYHKNRILKHLFRYLSRHSNTYTKSYIQESHFHFDPNILTLPDNVYIDGFWQSEKYFADIAHIISEEFTLKNEQIGKDKELAAQINSTESISIHIRRQDYIRDPNTIRFHGHCHLEYYLNAIETLTKAIKRPHFFIFSDEPEWTQLNFKIKYPTTYISHNGSDRDFEDLRLMSQCSHHIIANSTFSWWAAWLNKNPDKMVFAPQKWFNTSRLDTKDLLPDKWVRI